jgi:hypothetical protein
MRRCGRCDEVKPVDQFNWRRKGRGQRDNYCRTCRSAYHREHYLSHRQKYIDQARRRKVEVTDENTKQIVEYLRGHPCVECGERDILVLEFDSASTTRRPISNRGNRPKTRTANLQGSLRV